MSKLIREISLGFTDGNSDKVYRAELFQNDSGSFDVMCFWGRRGSSLSSGSKALGATIEKAEAAFAKVVSEKVGKGYVVESATDCQAQGDVKPTISTALPVAKEQSGMSPQLLNPVEKSEALALLSNPAFFAQLKADGERKMVSFDNGTVVVCNRKGEKLPVTKELESIAGAFVLSGIDRFVFDCEQIGSKYFVFDVLAYGVFNGYDSDFETRVSYLREIKRVIDSDRALLGRVLDVLEPARDTAEKHLLFSQVQLKKLEGLVFKRKDSMYKAGRPNSGGDALKFKFVDSATVRVAEGSDGKRSVALEVIQDGHWVPCGRVTIPANFDIPTKGDLVEVRYLYAQKPTNALFQPVYLGKRTDLDESACQIGQFKFKSESISI